MTSDSHTSRPRAAASFALWALLLLLPVAGPAFAQDVTAETAEMDARSEPAPMAGEMARTVQLVPTPSDAMAPAAVPIEEGAIQLSLERAIEITLSRNLGLVIERYNWIQQRNTILQNLGIYDLVLDASARFDDSTRPNTQVVEGVESVTVDSRVYTLGFNQLLPTGAVLDLGVIGSRTASNSLNQAVGQSYDANADFSLTQPLLRGFGRLPTERGIMLARIGASRTREFVEQRVAETIQDVEDAYWNLVGDREQLVVAQEALRLAQVLHEQNEVRVEVGTLAPLELIQSEAGIAARESEIITAEAAIGDSEDRLRQLLNLDQGDLWALPIVPVTDPAAPPIDIDLDRAIRTALAERPEVTSQLLNLEGLEIDVAFFRRNLLPQLDLQVGYGFTGLSPRVTFNEDGDPVGSTVGDQLDAFELLSDGDFPSWNALLTFRYPLQNRQARAQRAIAELGLDQGLAELEQLRNQIITEVRAAARRVESAAKQIEAARVSRELEEQNVEAERKRYENGMSSSYLVLQIQEQLTQARSREVAAITAYRSALAEYYRAIGQLLEQKGVELDAPEETFERPRYIDVLDPWD